MLVDEMMALELSQTGIASCNYTVSESSTGPTFVMTSSESQTLLASWWAHASSRICPTYLLVPKQLCQSTDRAPTVHRRPAGETQGEKSKNKIEHLLLRRVIAEAALHTITNSTLPTLPTLPTLFRPVLAR